MNIIELGSKLESGWPQKVDLEIPFCETMFKLEHMYVDQHTGTSPVWSHVQKVIEKMNIILSGTPKQVLTNSAYAGTDFKKCIDKIFDETFPDSGIFDDTSPETVSSFLRIAAFYHDIGKVIQNDRHPTIGYFYMTLVGKTESDRLLSILGPGTFNLLCDMVRYHDLFGVLGTGEASALALLDAIPFRSNNIKEQQAILSLLLLLNLADIAGTVELPASKAMMVIGWWERLVKLIEESDGNRQEFSRRLLIQEQNPINTIARIQRLLMVRAPARYLQDFQAGFDIEHLLRITLGPAFNEFCSDFALICKLDYALRFIERIGKYADSQGKTSKQFIEVIIALLIRIVQCYSSLTRRQDGTRRRVGIQVLGWTRTEEFSDKLVELLFDDLLRGVGWASEEPTAWYFD